MGWQRQFQIHHRKRGVKTMRWSQIAARPEMDITCDWGDIEGKPTLYPTQWGMIGDLPGFFDGTWISLTGKPIFPGSYFDGTWASLSGKPALFSGAYGDLTGLPTLFSGSYSALAGVPTIFASTWALVTGKPSFATVATTGAYADLSGQPTLAPVATTGSYADLTGKPTIPIIQRTRAQTDTSGNLTWTFPAPYGTGVVPIITAVAENASTTVSYNVQIVSISATAVTVKVLAMGGIVITLLGLTLLQFNSTPQAYVHLTAQAP